MSDYILSVCVVPLGMMLLISILFVFCHAPSPACCAFEGIYFEQVLCHSLWVDFDCFHCFSRTDCPFRRIR